MKVGIDLTTLILPQTGTGRVVFQTTKAVIAIDPKNEYSLFFFSAKTPMDLVAFQKDNVEIRSIRIPTRIIHGAWKYLRFPPIDVFCKDIDVLQISEISCPPFRNQNIVGLIHDLTTEKFPQYHTTRNIAFHKKRNAYLRKYAKRIITVSKSSKKDIVEILGIDEKRIIVAHPGVDSLIFRKIENETAIDGVLERYNLSRNPGYLLYVGTMEPRKNILGIIRAYSILKSDYLLPHQLVMVGQKGWLYNDIFNAIKELGLQEYIKSIGYVPDADLPYLLSGGTVLLYPSFYEGFGLPVLEGMACGIPVITSRVSSLPELAADAALLIDPSYKEEIVSAVLELVQNESRRQDLIQKGFKRAKQFTWEKTAESVIRAYKEACSA